MRPKPQMPRVSMRVGVLLTCAVLILIAAPVPAQAEKAGWATFAPLTGTSKDYTTTMTQKPYAFPVATVRSTSVGGSAVGVQTAAFLAPTTPPGSRYSSSRGATYLNLRPNTLSAGAPSVTTYTFARPTPSSGWTFVLGDIDSDEVAIEATDAASRPVTAAQLGFRSTFNYCAPGTSPKPPCTPPNNDGSDLPTWIPATSTLRGNVATLDTAGASAWFEPTVALKTLTFTYRQRKGSPVYQTWFSALEFDLTGTVALAAGIPSTARAGLTVRLYDPAGNEVASARTNADGTYAFPGLATYDRYRVQLVRPVGYTSDRPLSATVDLSTDNQVHDFSLRRIVPSAVGGAVTGPDGPLEGVAVSVTGPNGFRRTVTTQPNGTYVFEGVPAGADYVITVVPPTGYLSSEPASRTFSVPPNSETPITGQDFALAPAPTGTVSGTITDDRTGEPLDDVEIQVTGPGGLDRVVRTDANGRYAVPDLPPGTYTVTVVPPTDGTVAGSATRTAAITNLGNTVVEDFSVRFPVAVPTYEIRGTVLDERRRPVPGSSVSLQPPGGGDPIVLPVNDDGTYAIPDQPAGTYTVTVIPPPGRTVVGDASTTVTIVDANATGVGFVIRAVESPSPSPSATPGTPSPTAAPSRTPSASASSNRASATARANPLAATGAGAALAPLLGLGLLGLAAGGIVLAGGRRGRRR